MDYQLLALDLDDTLLNRDHRLSQVTVEVINQIKKMGVIVTIATGRMFTSSLPYIEELKISEPVITYNGAYMKDISRGETLYHQPIQSGVARDIICEAEKEGLHINYYHEDKLYVAERNELIELYEDIAGVKAETIGLISDNVSKSPTKLLIIEKDREKKKYYLNYFKERYSKKAEIKESKDYFIEFTDKGVSKGNSLARLAEKYAIPRGKTVAIGDGWNDAEMIDWAGLGIAMGNADQGVKKKADLIAPPHDENGAADILSRVFKLE